MLNHLARASIWPIMSAFDKWQGEDTGAALKSVAPILNDVRLKSSFDAIKDMHKTPGHRADFESVLGQPQPDQSNADLFRRDPYAIPAYQRDQQNANRVPDAFSALPPQQGLPAPGTPMPQPRPPMLDAMAQGAPEQPRFNPAQSAAVPEEMPWWKRNAMMQTDPTTGQYLDPQMAAQANPNVFKGLFG